MYMYMHYIVICASVCMHLCYAHDLCTIMYIYTSLYHVHVHVHVYWRMCSYMYVNDVKESIQVSEKS